MSYTALIRSFVVAAAVTAASAASALDPAKEQVVLTVSGAITETNAGQTAEFDLAMLKALGAVTVETSTIWTDGVQSFVGVPLDDLLAAVGAEGSMLKASAINDYAVEIPVGDAVPGGPIVAYMRNGDAMSVREKGPLWIVYPFDSTPDYQSELIYSRSIWQLDRIEVQP
ncbi:oxidoreductase [Aestuariicoccus sp. MJ-SS9]|uniref:oxidoreductase n=1 Tax=Aestuariicoccus sp. MJ-SS9 TaxID=3079855 RepID=UPI0029156FF5|nr:oxidoreductase [Aestuariicoccus sp. MJ-SS9]MDU8913699.1 oxidoreductase [Aestuariicoccus sp. MJ-SS9]